MPEHHGGPDRRQFLQAGAAGAGATLATPLLHAAQVLAPLEMTRTGPGEIPRKPLGRTGEQVSVIGLGGYAVGAAPTLEEAVRIVHEAMDAGVNFLDNAWEYHHGRAEEWMGQALRRRRHKAFLMT